MILRRRHAFLLPAVLPAFLAVFSEACSPSGSTGPTARVFFVEPQNGAVIPPLSTVRFGVENFVVEPVGDGVLHPGAGHHHLGIDAKCLPAGRVIPRSEPWIHFGDGSSEIEIQLTPGRHTLVLQPGDAEHRTLKNLCATIEVVAE